MPSFTPAFAGIDHLLGILKVEGDGFSQELFTGSSATTFVKVSGRQTSTTSISAPIADSL